MKFFKYQGAGNDFILIEDYQKKYLPRIEGDIPYFCDRNYGIGADGCIFLYPSRIATVRMKFFNSDGGAATMCGNGIRCVVKHLKEERVSIETDSGIALGKNMDGEVHVTFPAVEEILSPIALEQGETGHLIDTGVPHLVVFTDDLERDDFEEYGRKLRFHKMFAPEGVNVSIAFKDEEQIHIRTYERGVEGETLACGTACAASAYLARKEDNQKFLKYTVFPKSSSPLHFTFDNQKRMWMRGPAKRVFYGKIATNTKKEQVITAV